MLIAFIMAAFILLVLFVLIVYAGKQRQSLLRKYPTFSAKHQDKYPPVSFQYVQTEDGNLKTLRQKYELDRVAGNGSEIERIINLMKWVNQLSRHASNPTYPQELNALRLIDLCRSEDKKLNCMMYAIILNEVYLCMGYPSRVVHLLPHSNEHKESHWVNCVYSTEIEKWIMMDADMCAYLRDESDQILGIGEIRHRMVTDEKLMVNDEIGGLSKHLGKWSYPWYLSKNIFRCRCQQISQFDQESRRDPRIYYELIPDGFHEEWLTEPKVTKRGNKTIYINDERLFWQRPQS